MVCSLANNSNGSDSGSVSSHPYLSTFEASGPSSSVTNHPGFPGLTRDFRCDPGIATKNPGNLLHTVLSYVMAS